MLKKKKYEKDLEEQEMKLEFELIKEEEKIKEEKFIDLGAEIGQIISKEQEEIKKLEDEYKRRQEKKNRKTKRS